MNRSELKNQAKEMLRGKWLIVILAFVVVEAATASSSLTFIHPIFGAFSIITILLIPIGVGHAHLHYNIALGKQEDIGDLLEPFTQTKYVRALIGALLMVVYIIGWSLLFLIPGIIKAFAYSQTFFILQDPEFKDLTGDEAITKSREMMNGHKMEFFILSLSFIGWYILVGLTFGILLLYVAPYVQQTMAQYYLKLKSEY